MSASKYKKPSWKKQNRESHQSVCNLRKENAYLKKCLVELSHQHSGLYKLLEVRFVRMSLRDSMNESIKKNLCVSLAEQ